MFFQLSKELSSQGLAFDFTGSRRPYKYRISGRDLTSNIRRSRESRSESESNSEFNPVSISSSPVFLPNSNLKSPPSNPYEAWPKGYIFVICRVVDCGH
ncbi:hypothetical protein AVEN_252166-1 [Araneus ventricosus]|uniref:Uncharacterized protein n=1 Tax=Araneus ventricosus TaxID=182803 RepID=A0A4Y2FV89_ARAVE|nr:hypothetical protein AVEN_252166-1 [Araneus ventricosus]